MTNKRRAKQPKRDKTTGDNSTHTNGHTTNDKLEALEPFRESGADETLTTNQGTRINDDQNSLKAGARGPSLLEDFILREKITHFDHERIPERVVHARGAAAHGYFRVTSRSALTGRSSSRNRQRRPRSSCGSPRWRARGARATWRATCAGLR